MTAIPSKKNSFISRLSRPANLLCRAFLLLMLSTGLATTTQAAAPPETGAETKTKQRDTPVVIAHRGASGYLPEHTLAAKALAYGMKPDYIEQDLVMSKDDQLIVIHDIYLDNITDVASKFPQRGREDSHFYVIDFTLAELRTLRVSEPFTTSNGKQRATYPGRFPIWSSRFQLSTLEEELELIQGLNKSLGYNIGIYPEIKKPYFHHNEGKDIAAKTLDVLKKYGYVDHSDRVYLQSFDAEELQRIYNQLMPERDIQLPLVQLIAVSEWGEKQVTVNGHRENYSYEWMLTKEGLEKIAQYAAGIGPWFPMLVETSGEAPDLRFRPGKLSEQAHKLGLQIHPYTFRADPEKLPVGVESFEQLLTFFVDEVRVDGLFTDQPDRAIDHLKKRSEARKGRKIPIL